jgi:hypothetical protein
VSREVGNIYVADPGVVGVELLPPIPTDDYSVDNADAKREELHALFARRLEEGGQGAAPPARD